MGSFGQTLGQLNQSSGLSSTLPITSSAASTVYQAHYGLNSLGKLSPTVQIDHQLKRQGSECVIVCKLCCSNWV